MNAAPPTPGHADNRRRPARLMAGGVEGRVARTVALTVALGATFAAALGCEPYRIEHHRRPAFHYAASSERLPDRLVRDDGTVIIFGSGRASRPGKDKGDDEGEIFQIRVEDEDGRVTLQNFLPEHVVANAMTCIRNREWQLMWRQLVAERARSTYMAEGKSFRDFAEFMEQQREPIMEMLNRMSFGFGGPDVIVEQMGGGAMQIRLGQRIASQFKFTVVETVPEGGGQRLLTFR